jgi:hypothetical protein
VNLRRRQQFRQEICLRWISVQGGYDRPKEKIDALIRLKAGDEADAIIADIDHHFLRTHGHAQPHGRDSEDAQSAP